MTTNKGSKTYPLRTAEEQFEHLASLYPERDPDTLGAVVLKRRVDTIREFKAQIPDMYKESSLSDFGYFGDDIVHRVLGMFEPDGDRTLLMTGSVGSGKTHACYAIVNMILDIDPARMVLMRNYPEFIQDLRGEFFSNTFSEYGSNWDRVTNAEDDWRGLVILDDIGSNKMSEFEMEKLYLILDKRLSNNEPTIITTNIPEKDQESILGSRVSSRFDRFTRVELPKYDFRKNI